MYLEAIVIKKVPLREHDQLVTLYCRTVGKITAVAKSILKIHSVQALQMDEGNLIHCELVSGRGTPIITGAQAITCLSSAKMSAVRWAAAQFFLQVIDAIVYDQQQDEALFACLANTLSELDAIPDDCVNETFRRRQSDMLRVLGYGSRATGTTGPRQIDDVYESIAQRRLGTLGIFYELANKRFS